MHFLSTLPLFFSSALALNINRASAQQKPCPDAPVSAGSERIGSAFGHASLPAHVPEKVCESLSALNHQIGTEQSASEVQEAVNTLGVVSNDFYYEFHAFPDYISYDIKLWTSRTMAITNAFNNATQLISVNCPLEPEGFRSFLSSATAHFVYDTITDGLRYMLTVKTALNNAGIPPDVVYNTVLGWDTYSNMYHRTLTKALGSSAGADLVNSAQNLKELLGQVMTEYDELASTEAGDYRLKFWTVVKEIKAWVPLC